MDLENLILAKGLSAKELADIKELEDTCSKYESLNMKLNWDMLESRPKNQVNDILYYEDGVLIGFLGLYRLGSHPVEAEVMVMVHPENRLKGIAKSLLSKAIALCKRQGTSKLLLITERSSFGGVSFIKSTESKYSHTEYRMIFSEQEIPEYKHHGIWLRKALKNEYRELFLLDSEYFTGSEANSTDGMNIADELYDSTYVAELYGKPIGKIGVSMEAECGYIFGFVVRPEYRRQGFGREILCQALGILHLGNIKKIMLEVAVDNENALALYKSCGFKILTTYDYYFIDLTKIKDQRF